jgi:hypothetical protein
MKSIDSFLSEHDVDVGKSLAVLSFAAAVWSIFDFVGMLFVGHISINLSTLTGIVLGIALWRHRSWARTLLIVLVWLAAIGSVTVLFDVLKYGAGGVKLSIGRIIVNHPQPWHFYVIGLMTAPLLGLSLGVLHSAKARAEFMKPA